MRRDIDNIAPCKAPGWLVFKTQNRSSLHQHDPFIAILVIPSRCRRLVALRNNALYPQPRGLQQIIEELLLELPGDILPYIFQFHMRSLVA